MPDLSAQFRIDLPEAYDAFQVFDRRQLSLIVIPAGQEPSLSLRYATLLYTLAAPSGTRLDMVFGAAVVSLSGRNLLAVRDAIAAERCAWLQQFDAGQWEKEPEPGQPFIGSITYHLSVSPEQIAERET